MRARAKAAGQATSPPTPEERVLLSIRGPRVLAGVVVGAAIGGAGVVYQGLFRNPLVSPDVLGVSAGAGLGAVIGIFLSLPVVAIQLLAVRWRPCDRGARLRRSPPPCKGATRPWCWCWAASWSARSPARPSRS